MSGNDSEIYRAVTTGWVVDEPQDEPWHEGALFHSGEELKLMEENTALRQRLAILDAQLIAEKKRKTREPAEVTTLRRAITDFAHLYLAGFAEGDLRNRVAVLETELADLRAFVGELVESERRAADLEQVFERELLTLESKVLEGHPEGAEPGDFDYTSALEESL